MLNKEAVEEFKLIYLEEVGVLLSQEEAIKKATDMLNLFKLLSKPVKKRGSNFVRSDGLTKSKSDII